MWNPFRKKVEPVAPVVELEAPKVDIKMGDTEVVFTPGPAVTKFDPAQIERYKLSRDQIANYLAECTVEGRKRHKLGDPAFQAKLEVLREELKQLEKICKAFE